jgi:hypothetical protein
MRGEDEWFLKAQHARIAVGARRRSAQRNKLRRNARRS